MNSINALRRPRPSGCCALRRCIPYPPRFPARIAAIGWRSREASVRSRGTMPEMLTAATAAVAHPAEAPQYTAALFQLFVVHGISAPAVSPSPRAKPRSCNVRWVNRSNRVRRTTSAPAPRQKCQDRLTYRCAMHRIARTHARNHAHGARGSICRCKSHAPAPECTDERLLSRRPAGADAAARGRADRTAQSPDCRNRTAATQPELPACGPFTMR